MTEFSINPSWFYWIDVLGNFKIILAVFFAIAIIAFIIACLVIGVDSNYRELASSQKEIKIAVKVSKIAIITMIVLGMGLIFIPNCNALTEMMIAKCLNESGHGVNLETVKSAVDYIVEAFAKIKG